jgi:hypothetical protein
MRCKEPLNIPSQRVELSSGISMLVHGMPIGVDYLFSKVCSAPTPPFTDNQVKGQPIQRIYNEHETKYINQLEEYQNRKMVFTVWLVTNKDPDNEYDTKTVTSAKDVDAIYNELLEIGLTPQDYMKILTASMEVSNTRKAEEVRQDFSVKDQEKPA